MLDEIGEIHFVGYTVCAFYEIALSRSKSPSKLCLRAIKYSRELDSGSRARIR